MAGACLRDKLGVRKPALPVGMSACEGTLHSLPPTLGPDREGGASIAAADTMGVWSMLFPLSDTHKHRGAAWRAHFVREKAPRTAVSSVGPGPSCTCIVGDNHSPRPTRQPAWSKRRLPRVTSENSRTESTAALRSSHPTWVLEVFHFDTFQKQKIFLKNKSDFHPWSNTESLVLNMKRLITVDVFKAAFLRGELSALLLLASSRALEFWDSGCLLPRRGHTLTLHVLWSVPPAPLGPSFHFLKMACRCHQRQRRKHPRRCKVTGLTAKVSHTIAVGLGVRRGRGAWASYPGKVTGREAPSGHKFTGTASVYTQHTAVRHPTH